ncbi:HAD-superfamily hydrolase, subfamily IIB [Beutenbergia cavernae DSM 12333]|uniref:HAD-superfamily hydrolase, subfamily IIB n=1 Tax=Beutenbergia cavernae (strain ATCC BAA-8 / DSM 12333 / CCUG 43141 / JCM 11478 / NBRC 16432 / NCIMB 13614 / HKI 0122) TaxID=471853 RepID=C5BWI6_BEUC1|nr:HAD family hydrolase [Beutenbergia cavernae]ACQ78644.1 HAD-superfamily hydrolase, subfamily IIB [Beutenbergia cavernae DSM 12333]
MSAELSGKSADADDAAGRPVFDAAMVTWPAGPDALVALDIDGTLLGHDGSMSVGVRDAVAALREAGTHLVLSTGRSVPAVLPVAEELGLDRGWAVCSNGAVTITLDPESEKGYEFADLVTFDAGPAVRTLLAEQPGVIVAVEDLGRGFKVSAPFPMGELGGEVEVVDLEEMLAEPATRVTLRAPQLMPADFADLVDRVGLHGVAYAVGWTAWLDLTPDGVSKASALEQVRGWAGVAPERTLAAGDGNNDREMLRWAGLGVAMGGADADTVLAADARTGPVEDDGVVPVLRALLRA